MSLFVNPIQFQNDEKGRSTPFAAYYFYENNTFVFKSTYADIDRTVINDNPVIADGAGRFPKIYLASDEPYRVRFSELKNPNQYVPVWTEDDVTGGLDATDAVSSIDSVANIAGYTGTTDDQQISLKGWHPDSDVGGGTLYWDTAALKSTHNGVDSFSPTVPWTLTTADYLAAVGETDGAGAGVWRLRSGQIITNLTKSIPTDFATIQAAIDDIHNRLLPAEGVQVNINIESAHALTAGFRLDNDDYGYFNLTSTDATVNISASFTPVINTDLDSSVPRSTAIGFLCVNGVMPRWNMLVDISAFDLSAGYELDWNSTGIVEPTFGIKNGIHATLDCSNVRITTGSNFHGASGVFSGADGQNVGVTVNAEANVYSADLSNSGITGLDVSRASRVYAQSVDVSGCARGIYVRRSTVMAQLADFSNCTTIGLWAAIMAKAQCVDAVFDGVASGIIVDQGATVDCSGALKSGVDLPVSDINIEAFNQQTNLGIITNKNYEYGSVPFLTSATTALTTNGVTMVTVASATYSTLLDVAGQKRLYSGIIYGADVGLRITIDGVVQLNDQTRLQGDDDAGDAFSVAVIPACQSQTNLKIELYNRSSVSKDIGWRIYTD